VAEFTKKNTKFSHKEINFSGVSPPGVSPGADPLSDATEAVITITCCIECYKTNV